MMKNEFQFDPSNHHFHNHPFYSEGMQNYTQALVEDPSLPQRVYDLCQNLLVNNVQCPFSRIYLTHNFAPVFCGTNIDHLMPRITAEIGTMIVDEPKHYTIYNQYDQGFSLVLKELSEIEKRDHIDPVVTFLGRVVDRITQLVGHRPHLYFLMWADEVQDNYGMTTEMDVAKWEEEESPYIVERSGVNLSRIRPLLQSLKEDEFPDLEINRAVIRTHPFLPEGYLDMPVQLIFQNLTGIIADHQPMTVEELKHCDRGYYYPDPVNPNQITIDLDALNLIKGQENLITFTQRGWLKVGQHRYEVNFAKEHVLRSRR